MADRDVARNADRPNLSEVEDAVRELTARHVMPQLEWYRRRKRWPRVLYRSSGVLVILASVLIPVLAQTQFLGRDLILSALGVLVAVLTSLSSFFAWDQVWRSWRFAESALERAIAKWEVELKRAQLGLAETDPRDYIFRATDDLVTRTYAAVEAEEGQYFESVHAVEGSLSSQARPMAKE